MLEAICPKCGKRFVPAPQHAHVDHRGAYCKPTCWLHRDDGVEDKRKTKGQKVVQYNLDGTVVATFDTLNEVALVLNCSPQRVSLACRNKTEFRGYKWRYAEGK